MPRMSHPITHAHRSYNASLARWQRLRDASGGRDAVQAHDRGQYYVPPESRESYLPPLSGQSFAEYRAYSSRAVFFGATDRTVNALAGLIYAKDPEVETPSGITRYLDDIDLGGTSARDFSQRVAFEELLMGRVGVMVEFPSVSTEGMTIAQAEIVNARPYLTHWLAEQIIDWRTGNVPGQGNRLTMVKLKEAVEVVESEFVTTIVQQYRVLDLFEGYYRQRLWREGDGDDWILAAEIYPQANGKRLSYIPFHIVGGPAVRKPLLLDMADVNFAHYRTDADLSHALHMTALPTPYVAGVQLEAGQSLHIGSSAAWVFPDPQAKAGFLEFTGAGVQPMQDRLESLQQTMAVLGARMLLETSQGKNETFGGAELRTAGDRGTLTAVARDVSETMTKALTWLAEWVGASGPVRFDLNTDYGAHKMDPQMLAQLVAAVQGGIMPMSVFIGNLRRGDIVPQGTTDAEYLGELDASGPAMTVPTL